ncbi:MAG: DUF4160 domain-containing protein [Candidatus Brocadiaceae bacterium]
MSPTVFRYNQYKFLFLSREERRMRVHVWSPEGEAKIWLEPEIGLAVNKGLKQSEISELLKITKERIHEIKESWRKHFSS